MKLGGIMDIMFDNINEGFGKFDYDESMLRKLMMKKCYIMMMIIALRFRSIDSYKVSI